MELDILHALQDIHGGILDKIMLFITSLGNAGVIWFLVSFLLIIIPAVGKESKEHLKERRIAGIILIVSIVFEFICVNIFIKNIVNRPRPFLSDESLIPLIRPGESSFPSGHAASSFAAATSLFLYRKKAGLPAYLLAGAIAFSRLYIGVHYPTDVLAGMVIGIVCGGVVNKLVRKRVNKIGEV